LFVLDDYTPFRPESSGLITRKSPVTSEDFPLAFCRRFAILAIPRVISVYRLSFTGCCVLACAQVILSAPLERSVSSSRQFLVYGADVRLRGAICDLAEKTKRDVIQLIDQRDEWTTPVLVNAQYRQANLPERPRAALNLAQTGFGLKLQLDLTIASDVRQPEVRRELLRAILSEMMYRAKADLPAGTAYVSPPDWLIDGILPPQSEWSRERLIGVLGASVTVRKILPLEEFLRQRPERLDGPGRSLYGAYSFALVELLTRTPDGRKRLARFIADLPSAPSDPMANLGSHFPELGDTNSAERTWSLHVARLGRSQPFQLLSAEETERKLDESAKFIRDAPSKVALTHCSRDLSILATRANPIYRPLISEYAKIVTLLAQGRDKGTAERLARLSATRTSMSATIRLIKDYINWFEATKSPGLSGAFAGYLGAAELAAGPGERRRDAISVYLDVLEAQFQN
jgi:hypothetical protein